MFIVAFRSIGNLTSTPLVEALRRYAVSSAVVPMTPDRPGVAAESVAYIYRFADTRVIECEIDEVISREKSRRSRGYDRDRREDRYDEEDRFDRDGRGRREEKDQHRPLRIAEDIAKHLSIEDVLIIGNYSNAGTGSADALNGLFEVAIKQMVVDLSARGVAITSVAALAPIKDLPIRD